jgi:hypothetical protein
VTSSVEPRRHRAIIESAEEQWAYLLTHFGEPDSWTVASQRFEVLSSDREVERVEVRLTSGASIDVEFIAARTDSPFESEASMSTEFLDKVMEAAFAFSAKNPPHHPGSLSRFPVPSAGYANSLAVPLAVLAVDGGRRGLYAPPRVVVLALDTMEPRGVGEFPGFDPESWPPARLGDWPPPQLARLPQQQVQGTIMRFSAVWYRLLQAWFASEVVDSPDLRLDAREALILIERLDVPGMLPCYARLNPVFWKWLTRHAGELTT